MDRSFPETAIVIATEPKDPEHAPNMCQAIAVKTTMANVGNNPRKPPI
jgi:hypothetical protein